jgi:hypothetical protein
MGFLSKLFKKAKPLLPLAAMFGAGPLMGAFGATGGLSGLFGGMNPVVANFLKQGALNYGIGRLTGAKHPEKGALWAGAASIPFSLMGGASAASEFNKARGLKRGDTGYQNMWDVLSKGQRGQIGPFGTEYKDIPSYIDKPKLDYRMTGHKPGSFLDIGDQIRNPGRSLYENITPRVSWESVRAPQDIYGRVRQMPTGAKTMFDAPEAPSMFTKPGMMNKITGKPTWFGGVPTGETAFNMMPTLASQAAGLYGGRMTPEEEWAAAKEKRRKELAWMYGVPEDMIEGEMTNPWDSGGFWNKGGIASLQNGGDVSGPGTGTSDSINANLSDGEFVMTAKAVENLGGGDRYEGARKMYDMMNVLDPESETMQEVV